MQTSRRTGFLKGFFFADLNPIMQAMPQLQRVFHGALLELNAADATKSSILGPR